MTEHPTEPRAFDTYADQFTITITPFGANLSFATREPHPSPGRAPQSEHRGTMRMSVEHLKTMVVIVRRQIRRFEEDSGVTVGVPRDVLNQLGISPEDWNAFWA